jgi:hypothetical protein
VKCRTGINALFLYFNLCKTSCNMNALFSFHLFVVYIPEWRTIWNNTCSYEILNNLNLSCSFITLRDPCDNQRKSKKYRQHNDQKTKDKQRSTKHTYKTKDRVTRTPLKTGNELRCSRRVFGSCSTSGTHHHLCP